MAVDVLTRCRASSKIDLATHDPNESFGWEKEAAKAEFVTVMEDVAGLHERLFAGESSALLLVLQAMDAGGKDGTIRTVLRYLNPAGVDVNSFGVPSDEERSHDYLWRVHHHAPSKGLIGVFNRSHYEEVLVVRVKGLAPEAVWSKRYRHINEFERMLVDEGTTIIKCFLNVSKAEQAERFQDRLDDPSKRWKFRAGDLADRKLWPKYQQAYDDMIAKTSTSYAPWYVIPADHNWVRNLAVAKILLNTLAALDPKFPDPEAGIRAIKIT